jgi:thioredoxin reductase
LQERDRRGLSAAIYALRSGHSAAVIERLGPGGQAATAAEIENYPGLGKIAGWDLAAALEKHAKDAGAQIIYDEIKAFDLKDGIKKVTAAGGEYQARAVVLAMGASRRLLGVPGEKELSGRGVSILRDLRRRVFQKKSCGGRRRRQLRGGRRDISVESLRRGVPDTPQG